MFGVADLILLSLCVFIGLLLLIRAYMKWSNVWCTSAVRMDGKVVVVTGGNAGIGYEAARALALRGARVILACRSEQRGVQARDALILATGNKDIKYYHLDLSSLDSVRHFARKVSNSVPRLDVLINNAGMHGGGDKTTGDGLVLGLQVNYLAPFLLTLLLLPMLRASHGRIVNVASLCHFLGEVKLEKFNHFGEYNDGRIYRNSKLAQVIFTKELSRRLSAAGEHVTVNALHPGVIYTNIARESPILTKKLFALWCWLCNRSVEEGAQTTIYLAVADEVANISGKYFVDCSPAYRHCKVQDEKLAQSLWEYSINLVKYEELPMSDNIIKS